jgi:hypothetical protein
LASQSFLSRGFEVIVLTSIACNWVDCQILEGFAWPRLPQLYGHLIALTFFGHRHPTPRRMLPVITGVLLGSAADPWLAASIRDATNGLDSATENILTRRATRYQIGSGCVVLGLSTVERWWRARSLAAVYGRIGSLCRRALSHGDGPTPSRQGPAQPEGSPAAAGPAVRARYGRPGPDPHQRDGAKEPG